MNVFHKNPAREPVAWLVDSAAGKEVFLYKPNADHTAEVQHGHVIPLYAAPAQTPAVPTETDAELIREAIQIIEANFLMTFGTLRIAALRRAASRTPDSSPEGYGGWQGGDTETEKAGRTK